MSTVPVPSTALPGDRTAADLIPVTPGSGSASGRLLLLAVPPDTGEAERDLSAASTPTPLRTTALLAQATLPAPPGGAAAAVRPVTTGAGRTA